MKKLILLFLFIVIPFYAFPDRKTERISLTVNGVTPLFGVIQLDYSMKFESFELSLKPGVLYAYMVEGWPEKGGFEKGLGILLTTSFNRYFTKNLYYGIAVPMQWMNRPPQPDVDYMLRTGVGPLFGWKRTFGHFILAAEASLGIGITQIELTDPLYWYTVGWFFKYLQLGVGLSF
jgi:hypothetical protein